MKKELEEMVSKISEKDFVMARLECGAKDEETLKRAVKILLDDSYWLPHYLKK